MGSQGLQTRGITRFFNHLRGKSVCVGGGGAGQVTQLFADCCLSMSAQGDTQQETQRAN